MDTTTTLAILAIAAVLFLVAATFAPLLLTQAEARVPIRDPCLQRGPAEHSPRCR
jgi:hypothetical protein